jgi:membrane protease YdiL (CAAX protease family)
MFIFAVAIAPFFEECLFRGILLPMAIRKLGLGAGIFVISLLFAAIHFHLPSLIPLLIIASGFSLAYLYTKSLWVPIIMHGLFNGVNLALLLVMRH